MRTKLDQQLELLNNSLIEMGGLCETGIASAVKALMTNDVALSKTAIEVEKAIDEKQREIEGLCMKILLKQQPVAGDLRLISCAMKMVADMERIGDQAADIAEIVAFSNLSASKSAVHIEEMTGEAIKMVTQSIDSFVVKDKQLALSVIKSDDIVDGLFSQIKNDIIVLIRENSDMGAAAVDILMIAKYLERIGDHAVNIAEEVVALSDRHY